MPSSGNVLIVGGSGWLGQHLYAALIESGTSGTTVYITYTISRPTWVASEACAIQLDLGSDECAGALRSILADIKPDVVINLAAVSSPVKCQQNPSMAMKVNSATVLIDALNDIRPGALYVFSSSDLVYDGEKSPYSASGGEVPKPVNAYGLSKLCAETAIVSAYRGPYIILRLSNMVGFTAVYRPNGVKFLQFLYEAAAERRYIGIRNDEKRSFVGVQDVTQIIITAINKLGEGGSGSGLFNKVYNVGGPEGLSRLNLAEIVARSLSLELIVESGYIESSGSVTSATTNDHRSTYSKSMWGVYMQSSQESSTDVPTPRDVTMDITATELAFGISFNPMSEVVPKLLHKY